MRAAVRMAAIPGAAVGSVFACWAHDSSVSGPGAGVNGTLVARAAVVASRVRRPFGPVASAKPVRTAPPGWVAGSAAIFQIQATFSGSPIGAPLTAGATATSWVTKLATRSPLSGSRSSTSDGVDAGVGRPGQREPEPAGVSLSVRVLQLEGEDSTPGWGERQ